MGATQKLRAAGASSATAAFCHSSTTRSRGEGAGAEERSGYCWPSTSKNRLGSAGARKLTTTSMPMLIDAAPAAMRRNATSHAMSKPAGLGEKERVFSATQSAAASEASAMLVEDEPG